MLEIHFSLCTVKNFAFTLKISTLPLLCSIVVLRFAFSSVRPLVENGKNPLKYIRYTPEDLERMLSEFFEGKSMGEPKR